MTVALFALTRPRLSALAALGALAGALLARPVFDVRLFLAVGGAFGLAAGCSALNQVQERREDSRMRRAQRRPLVAGTLTPGQALSMALACLGASLLLFGLAGGWPPLVLAVCVVVLYNGCYTPLKKATAYAILIGGLAGACPPLVGFTATGGSLLDARIHLVAAVFYFWQVPHFRIFAQLHRADYQAAGFKVPAGISRFDLPLLAWTIAYGLSLLCLPALSLIRTPLLQGGLASLGLGLAVAALGLTALGRLDLLRSRVGFGAVNVSLCLFLSILAAEALGL